jgi:hypothetical protein
MKFITTSILMIMLISLIAISPVAAYNEQSAGATVIGSGSGNTAIANNDYNNYNYVKVNKVNQENDGRIEGDHNTMIQVNGNQQNSITDASITNNFEAVKLPANYYGLDAGVVSNYIASVYEGQVIVAANDQDSKKEIVSEAGDTFKYYIRSSVPVLAYVIKMNDEEKVKWDNVCAPHYDPFMDKFDLGNVEPIYVGVYRSPSQQFEVTIPEKGRYGLVIDTRVAHSLDGRGVQITDDSIDITYFVEQTGKGVPKKFERAVIGKTLTYPILSNGMANTA